MEKLEMKILNRAALLHHTKNLTLLFLFHTSKYYISLQPKHLTLIQSLTELTAHFLNPSFILLTFQPLLIPFRT